MKSLVVLGGTGFLGRQICQAALTAGWNVTSLTSRGKIDVKDWTSSSLPLASLSQIKWQKANVFDPDSYRATLQEADAVVHSMGTIFDNVDYKKHISGKAGPLGLVSLALSRLSGSNPMKKEHSAFTRLNRDSAVILAQEFSKVAGVDGQKPFVYISAEDWNPLAEKDYIRSKREAESEVDKIALDGSLRTIYFRPGFMYDLNEKSSLRGTLGHVAHTFTQATSLIKSDCATRSPTLQVQKVAGAVVEALDDASIEGVIPLEALQRYASYA